ncbi:hypothetical protein E0F15_06410 [Frankia sp. B2]|uniref:hypothetical protein n=1 Tax=Frankia sp. B2 TaxID=2541730 RepID=UPI0010699D91|nr:hypothetical protein [Frankia sp. B2]TFE33114.1 hypothetical protein E0F15_06410 [Frankia sp. B2]
MTDIDVDLRATGGEDDSPPEGSPDETRYVPRSQRPARATGQRPGERTERLGEGFERRGGRRPGEVFEVSTGPIRPQPAPAPAPRPESGAGEQTIKVSGLPLIRRPPPGTVRTGPVRPHGDPSEQRPTASPGEISVSRVPTAGKAGDGKAGEPSGEAGGRPPVDPVRPAGPVSGRSGPAIQPPDVVTATMDLSALQRRLRAEKTELLRRVEGQTPRHRRSDRRARRTDETDPESTQIFPRPPPAGRGGRFPGAGTARSRGRRRPAATGGGERAAAAASFGPGPGNGADGLVDDLTGDEGPGREGPGREGPGREGPGREGSGGRGGARSKAIWTLADQAVSSATNAAVSFLIAHQVSDVEYGAFGIAYTLFSIVIGLVRAGSCMPLSMFYSGATRSDFRAAATATTGSSFVFGVAVGIAFVGPGLLLGGPVGSSLSAMGLVLPGLLLQDAWRYVFFAMGKPFGAFVNDTVWAVVQIFGIFLLIHRGVTASPPLLLAWGASALVAALLGIAQAGFWPSPGETLRWLRRNKSNSAYLAAEFITVQGAMQTSLLVIGAVGSLATVGALQGARTLLGPTTVVGVGVVSFALPEFSKRTSMTRHARERAAYALSALVLAIGTAWSLIFYLLPERYGQALLGDSWDGVRNILGLSILHYLAASVPVGPACMVYALGKAKITFRVNAVFAPMLFGFPIIGLLVGEARGAVVGYNIAFWSIAPVWFVLLRRLAREHDAEQAALRAARGGSGPDPAPAGPGGRELPRPRRAGMSDARRSRRSNAGESDHRMDPVDDVEGMDVAPEHGPRRPGRGTGSRRGGRGT